MKHLILALLTLIMATNGFAYTSQSDCEAFEGAGNCESCAGGWHRSAACPPGLLAYEGTLSLDNAPVDGLYDIVLDLYGASEGGVPIAVSSTNLSVEVIGGVFHVLVDVWGEDDLSRPNLHVEVALRRSAEGPFVTLSPRQRMAHLPLAAVAESALSLSPGALAPSILGTNGVDGQILALGSVTGNQIASSQVVKSFNGLTDDVTLMAGEGISILSSGNNTLTFERGIGDCDDYKDCYWGLLGNTLASGSFLLPNNFLGTLNNWPVEMRVNNQRALRLEPTSSTPNLIGGFSGNMVTAGRVGATIGGGGAATLINTVGGNYGTVGGGGLNRATSQYAIVGGGLDNLAGQSYAVVGGGARNQASGYNSTIGGGHLNHATHYFTTIGGGQLNLASLDYATVAGGHNNTNLAWGGSIGGGGTNQIETASMAATIGGGQGNLIENAARFATVGGGAGNIIKANAEHGTVGGGRINIIYGGTRFASIVGGELNVVGGNTDHASIGGGQQNVVMDNSGWASIGGGMRNQATNIWTTVAGGGDNYARGVASTIGGGRGNVAANTGAVVSGGEANQAIGNSATVAGGTGNVADNRNATVSGGTENGALADYSTVGGGRNNFALGVEATVGGGFSNLVTNNLATVSGGANNTAGGVASSITGGQGASADKYGQRAHASGTFSIRGDAQGSLYVSRNVTQNGIPTELYLDGVAATERMTIPQNGTWTFQTLVVARDNNNHSGGWRIEGVVENVAGVPNLLFQSVTLLHKAVSAWDVTAGVFIGPAALSITATGGAAANPVHWVATTRTTETIAP